MIVTRSQSWYLVPSVLRQGRELDHARSYCAELLLARRFAPSVIVYSRDVEGEPSLARVERFVSDFEERTSIDLSARCRMAAEELLAGAAVLFKDKINFRHPRADGFAPHQDAAAGWGKYASIYATVAVFLEDSNPETGGFEFPLGPSPTDFYPNNNGQMNHVLFESLRPRSLYITAGDGILFDSYAPHRTHRNVSQRVIPHIFLTFNRVSEGSHRERYYSEKVSSMQSRGDAYEFRLFDFGS